MNVAYIKYAKIHTCAIDHKKKLTIRKYNWIFFYNGMKIFTISEIVLELIELYYYDSIDLVLYCEIMSLADFLLQLKNLLIIKYLKSFIDFFYKI